MEGRNEVERLYAKRRAVVRAALQVQDNDKGKYQELMSQAETLQKEIDEAGGYTAEEAQTWSLIH